MNLRNAIAQGERVDVYGTEVSHGLTLIKLTDRYFA